jgi:hypothetical protein
VDDIASNAAAVFDVLRLPPRDAATGRQMAINYLNNTQDSAVHQMGKQIALQSPEPIPRINRATRNCTKNTTIVHTAIGAPNPRMDR